MGQKIHPTGFRLAVTRNWGSRWYAGNSNFASMLKEDLEVRAFLKKKLKNASVGRVLIERPAKNARITIFSSRPQGAGSDGRTPGNSCGPSCVKDASAVRLRAPQSPDVARNSMSVPA